MGIKIATLMGENIRRFGTFTGVFVPTVLSIFGVILFLRSGWVVGYAGLFHAIIILALSEIITIITALSISSISTNMKVGVGGVYYLISRSLGVEAGGAIGIPLYLSQAISVAFYVLGFTESIMWLFPGMKETYLALIVLTIFTIVAYVGADLAVKLQVSIFILLILSILSFLIPGPFIPLAENLKPHYTAEIDFWHVFAVFFPAVTGITAGISMSGELRDPARNIPRGTLLAIGFTALVYLLVFIKVSAIAPHGELISNMLILMEKSPFPYLVYAGIWSATLSSALTFIVGAPRTLQALAKDGVVPRILAHPLGSKKDEPRLGVIITYLIAALFVSMGTLNTVATIITMFFLLTYAAINFSAGVSSLAGKPFYVPEFKVHHVVSLAGAVATFWIMHVISPVAAPIALAIIVAIYLWLERKSIEQTWGDMRNGIWFSLARFALLRLEGARDSDRFWRPNIMVFSGNPDNRQYLIEMASWLGKGEGIVTLFNVLEGDPRELIEEKERIYRGLKEFIRQRGIGAFAEVEIVRSFDEALPIIAQAHGLGKLSSNTALFGFPSRGERARQMMEIIDELCVLKKDSLILKYDSWAGYGSSSSIVIWAGERKNTELMLFLARILQLNFDWQDSRIRVMGSAQTASQAEELKKELEEISSALKVQAYIRTFVLPPSRTVDALREHAGNASLILFPLECDMDTIFRIAELKKSILFVRSCSDKELRIQ